ncbi:MAG: DNA methyltransferase [Candidatus Hermodarchaeota archaeon]
MVIEENFPVKAASFLAFLETRNRLAYRPIFSIHKYWARRVGGIFRLMALTTFLKEAKDILKLKERGIDEISAYFQRHDFSSKIVLDPFMGGGTTLIELLRLNAKVIGYDSNPIAWWTARASMIDFNEERLVKAFNKIATAIKNQILTLYQTTCPQCDKTSDVICYLWVREAPCEQCGQTVKLFKHYFLRKGKKKVNQQGEEKEWQYSPIVFCPDCYSCFSPKELGSQLICPDCSRVFNPKTAPFKKGTFRCSCGTVNNLVKVYQSLGTRPKAHIYSIEYYCNQCKQKGYRPVTQKDLDLYNKAEKLFDKALKEKNLLIPDQTIPNGYNTRQILNYNFHYWKQLFNKRQLYCLSLLLQEILKVTDRNSLELLLTAFSSSLEYHTNLAEYIVRQTMSGAGHVFSHHAYSMTPIPMENNVWGAIYGTGTFTRFFEKSLKAKRYCKAPFERYVDSKGKKRVKFIEQEKILGKFAANFEELVNTDKNVLIKNTFSQYLTDIPDKSIDAVITDPPYLDNVMYSELSDFFYVWLRLGLKDHYPEFKPEYVPREREIIQNRVQQKDKAFFLQELSQVFKECHRVLKDNSALMFTYHHKNPQAWSLVLQALQIADFYVSYFFPVLSEPGFNPHIKGKKAIEYDAILICRKREIKKDLDVLEWFEFKKMLQEGVDQKIEKFQIEKQTLTKGIIFVLMFGTAVEMLSKGLKIKDNGDIISLNETFNKVGEFLS